MQHKKVISKNVTEKTIFSLFTHVRQTFLLITFLLCIFLQLFQRIRNQRSAFFDIFSERKKNWGHISAFCKL
jgi:hypothetical protein